MSTEQRVVALMCTDVEGSTELTARRGDEAARVAIEAHRALVREQIAEHGGREVDSVGDGFLATFDSPRVAVVCAVAIQRSLERQGRLHPDNAVRVRVGINAGVVLDPVEGAPFGAAINATARVMARARGGEILVSDMARRLAGTVVDVSFRDCGEISLKGFDERWRLYDVVWREPEAASPAPRGRLPSARLHRRRPGLEGAAFGARELALAAPEGVRRALVELGRALFDGARSAGAADRLLATIDRKASERELTEGRIAGSAKAARAEARLAALETLIEQRHLLDAEVASFSRVERELATRVARARGSERHVAEEVYGLRDAVSSRVAVLDESFQATLSAFGGQPRRLSPRERFQKVRDERRLARLDEATAQVSVRESHNADDEIIWKGSTGSGFGA